PPPAQRFRWSLLLCNTPSPPSRIRRVFLHPSLVASDHLTQFMVQVRLCLLPCPIFQKERVIGAKNLGLDHEHCYYVNQKILWFLKRQFSRVVADTPELE
ncbi:hypothetical protein STEG23_008078, partial [Scotinomys teguina]